jgi:hypothetical protein
MPQGRVLDPNQATQLLAAGTNGERYYLKGRFVVTAAEPGRAILRQEGSSESAVLSTRVIVDFPNGTPTMAEGTPIARGNFRPFQILDVRRGNNGVINVYVRDVTQAWSPAQKNRASLTQQQRLRQQGLVSLD